jgi:hypothetical protein
MGTHFTIRLDAATRAQWEAKSKALGLTLAELVRQSVEGFPIENSTPPTETPAPVEKKPKKAPSKTLCDRCERVGRTTPCEKCPSYKG